MSANLLFNSLAVSGAATALALGLGLATALFAAGLGRVGQSLLAAAAAVALALPPFLVANCWLSLLGRNGAWRDWLPFEIYSGAGAVWVLAMLLWGLPFFAGRAAWLRLDPALFEADPALRGPALLRRLLWPAVCGAAGWAALVVFVLALSNFAVPALLQVRVLPAEIWVRFNTDFDPLGAMRLSLPLLVAVGLLFLLVRSGAMPWPKSGAGDAGPLLRRQLGGWWWAAGVAAIVLLMVAVALPVLDLVAATRTWRELNRAAAAGAGAIRASAVFAAGTAVLTTALGLCLARVRWGWVAWGLFLLPGVVLGVGLIVVFNRPPWLGFYQSSGIVFLALALRYFALGWQGGGLARAASDPELDAAARLDGVGWLARAWWVARPSMAPQVAATAYAVYLLCLWDVESLVLIVPPGGETLALRIFNLLHYGHNAQVNALCLILLGLALAPLAVFGLWRGCASVGCTGSAGGFWRKFGPFAGIGFPAAMVLLALGPGCSPPASRAVPIPSRLFDRVETIGTRGNAPGQFNKPRSVAVDREDNLYVVDITGRVQKFSPAGVFLLAWQMPQTDLGKPKGMGLDSAGRVVVIEPHYSRVNHFSPAGRLEQQWGVHGTNAGELAFPRAVAVRADGQLWVSEYGAVECVQRFTADGRRGVQVIGRPGEGAGEFNRPEGLGLDGAGRLYVADSCNHRIQVFDAEGRWLRAHGRAGTGPGEFSYPYDVRVDAAGYQFVSEFGNSRLQVFDSEDRLIETIGRAGAGPGEFNNPWSVALDSHGNLYVADANNHRVQKLIRRSAGGSGPAAERARAATAAVPRT
jgi:ABC-type Fe3+ transport system permease subunit/DNA-binding beta-propeller fold protein YncE